MLSNTKELSESTLIVCGIVRDCGKSLKRNIRTIMQLCRLAKDYHVVIYENDSADNSKQILQEWASRDKNIHVSLNTFGIITIPQNNNTVNPVYSKHRIEKMASYRNYYLEYIEKEKLLGDYVIVVDLDVYKIYLQGIIQAFALDCEWDALTATGISRAPSVWFRKRYFDAYALIECGLEANPKTERNIRAAQYRWAFIRRGMPLFRVASAFGGLAIYKRESIVQCRYGVLPNDDERVECHAEHTFFHQQMKERGHDRIFINPAIRIKYQTQVINTLRRTWRKVRK